MFIHFQNLRARKSSVSYVFDFMNSRSHLKEAKISLFIYALGKTDLPKVSFAKINSSKFISVFLKAYLN